MSEIMDINGRKFEVIRLLGKGKGGYSWLVKDDDGLYVLKQIHHEPCDYYQFGNKLESELRDYQRLNDLHLQIPKLLETDQSQGRILKEYIDGPTVMELVQNGLLPEESIDQVRQMSDLLEKAGLNIDWYPTNFIWSDGKLWYIDYECNEYSEKWDLENWGLQYWK